MDKIKIRGGRQLIGEIKISGAKNSVLPIMAASIMTEDTIFLENVPRLMDVNSMSDLLSHFGIEITNLLGANQLCLKANNIECYDAPYEIVRKMRASVLVLGPLLARFGKARVSIPGGCAIGTRPIDLHIEALEAMGAKIDVDVGYINATVKGRLKGAEINFRSVSVGATENILMAACLADGTTLIKNAASEPEIEDLGNLLIKMGAKISGLGTREISIEGVEALSGCNHRIISDRIEAATYLIAGAITKGKVKITDVIPEHILSILDKLRETGVSLVVEETSITLDARECQIQSVNISTDAYPGIPTDIQAQFMALMSLAKGEAVIQENVFENRFMHVAELLRMGADIKYHDRIAHVNGVASLKAAPVMATDLRASVSLVLAALAAEGETVIHRVYHLDRGYENLEEKLLNCGIDIEREKASVLV